MDDYLLIAGLLFLFIGTILYLDSKSVSEQPSQDPSESGKEAEKGDSEPEIVSVVVYDASSNAICLLKYYKKVEELELIEEDYYKCIQVSDKLFKESLEELMLEEGVELIESMEGDFDEIG